MSGYRATFSDGFTTSIKSSKRAYTHAWLVKGTAVAHDTKLEYETACKGFSSSKEQAHKNAMTESRYYTRRDLVEVVPVEVV